MGKRIGLTIMVIVISALALTSCVRPLMGTAVQADKLAGDTTYAQIAGSRFDVVAPENEMKWDTTEPQLGRFTFDSADPVVAFAQAHGQKVMGAALAWWFQNPDWLQNGTFSRAAATKILKDHIQALVSRFRGKVQMWDVVNEAVRDNDPLHPDPNDPSTNYHGIALRPNVWTRLIGPTYIEDAFRDARRYDPDARLYLNDYGMEINGPKRAAVLQMAKKLQARRIPIDGVGLQMHEFLPGPPQAIIESMMADYAAIHLDAPITEMDVAIPLPVDATKLDQQKTAYDRALQTCRAAPNCPAFIMWGFTDKYSWIPGFFPGLGAALPWDENFQPKPAYDAIASALRPHV